MIIWLASYPRSGNHYFRLLLRHFYGIMPYSVYLQTEMSKRNDEWLQKGRAVLGQIPEPLDVHVMAESSTTYIVKTHELPSDALPAIYLVRDGRDALISYAHFILTVERLSTDFEATLRNLIVNTKIFGGWSTHVRQWLHRQATTTLVRFEDLVRLQDPFPLVTQALRAVGYQQSTVKMNTPPPTFTVLHQAWPEIFRQGQIGSWRTEMSTELHELFWQHHGEMMSLIGYCKN